MASPSPVDDPHSVGLGMSMVIKSIKIKFSSVTNIDSKGLADLLKSGSETDVVLLDCRSEEEYNTSHIPGSVRVNWEFTSDRTAGDVLQSIPSFTAESTRHKAIVCYCSVGYRSSSVADKIRQFLESQDAVIRLTPVYNLAGSLFKWANEGRPMVDSTNQATVFAHPYNAVWGKLLEKDLRKNNP